MVARSLLTQRAQRAQTPPEDSAKPLSWRLDLPILGLLCILAAAYA